MTDGSFDSPPEPGAKAALGHGWSTFTRHFWILFGITVLAYLINGVGTGLQFGLEMSGVDPMAASGVGLAWALVVGIPVGAALQYAYLTAARGESPEVGILLEGFPHLLALLVAAILVGVATLVGFVLLVIPGIYVALRLGFVPLLVVDRGLDGLEAVKVCWSGMGGNILGLFLLALASIVIAFGGLLLLVVGIIPAGVWIMSSFAAYYRAVFDEPEPTPTDAVEPETDEPLHVPDAETA